MGSGRIVGPVLFAYDSLRHKMENFTAFAMMPSIIRMTFAPEKMWGQNFEIAPKSFHFNALVAKMVELRGIEPLTSSLRTMRSTN